MAMSDFEKLFVNRPIKGRRNFRKVRQAIETLDIRAIHHALEIGCGIGTVSALLAEKYGFQVLGVDADPDQIAQARTTFPESDHLRFKVEDAINLDSPNQAFDLVIAQHVFHHITDWKSAAKEVTRVLDTGGHLMWLDIVFPRPLRSLFRWTHRNGSYFDFDEVTSEFSALGLKQRIHESLYLGAFTEHHLVLQRR